jgi:hypothetical protein
MRTLREVLLCEKGKLEIASYGSNTTIAVL